METIDEKLRGALDVMRAALSEGEKARFRDFWQMKKSCLELFKEEMHPTKRGLFWNEYTALLKEAHELQNILDEQMNFQVEQISLAIDSLEKEILERSERILETVVEEGCERLLKEPLLLMRKQIAFYSMCQEKILSLRKEVLELEMRISQKNKMLARLSQLGDIVFPEKKTLVPEFSKALLQEIEQRSPLRKDRIKQYQGLLKTIPLTNEIYRKLRQQLSEAWDSSNAEELQKRESITRVQREERENSEKLVKAIASLEELAHRASQMKLESLQEEFHSQQFDTEGLTKRDLITVTHCSLMIRGLLNEDVRDETERLIELMRREMNHCGLDIAFAMKLKELIRESRERIELME